MYSDFLMENENELQPVCIWPDGTWCHKHKLPVYSQKTGDFHMMLMPEYFTDMDIEQIVLDYSLDRLEEEVGAANVSACNRPE